MVFQKIKFQGSRSFVFWAHFQILRVLIFSQICLEVSQRKTLLSPSRKFSTLPFITPDFVSLLPELDREQTSKGLQMVLTSPSSYDGKMI